MKRSASWGFEKNDESLEKLMGKLVRKPTRLMKRDFQAGWWTKENLGSSSPTCSGGLLTLGRSSFKCHLLREAFLDCLPCSNLWILALLKCWCFVVYLFVYYLVCSRKIYDVRDFVPFVHKCPQNSTCNTGCSQPVLGEWINDVQLALPKGSYQELQFA